MRVRPTILFLALAAWLVPGAARAQQLILEAEIGVDSLSSCDTLHNLRTCDSVHFSGQASLIVGGRIELDGRLYLLEWVGPGYHLESGIILEPLGEGKSSLAGQRWVEVYPKEGKIHTSRSWRDADGNKALGPADSLTLDFGGPVKVKDVRLHLRASPAEEQP
jgi:hypothetical protein